MILVITAGRCNKKNGYENVHSKNVQAGRGVENNLIKMLQIHRKSPYILRRCIVIKEYTG